MQRTGTQMSLHCSRFINMIKYTPLYHHKTFFPIFLTGKKEHVSY